MSLIYILRPRNSCKADRFDSLNTDFYSLQIKQA